MPRFFGQGGRPRWGQGVIVRRSPLLWILLGGFFLRVVAAFGLQHDLDYNKKRPFLMMGDAEGYWDLGRKIADRQPYELYGRQVLRMPGYPAFVAGSIRLADLVGAPQREHLVARLLTAAVGTFACGLVALLGRSLFDTATGTLAAAITAVAPPLIGFSVILLSETLFAAALLVSLLAVARFIRAAENHESRTSLFLWGAIAGAAIGLAVYVRPSWLLFAPGLAAMFVLYYGRGRRMAECVAAAAFLVACAYGTLLPWAYRNDRVTGHWVWTTLWVGPSLYDGLNGEANGESHMEFFERDRLMDKLSEFDVNRHYTREALAFARNHPGRALELTWDKLVRFWMPWPNAREFSGFGLRLAVAAYFIPAVICAVVGWLTGPRNFWGWTLTLGPILYFSTVHALFLGSLRYRLPAEYPLCIAAAVGAQQLWKRVLSAPPPPPSHRPRPLPGDPG